MEQDQFPGLGRCRQCILQPKGLCRGRRDAIRFVIVAVEHEEMHRAARQIVIAFVAGQGEVVEIGLCVRGEPVMVARCGEELVFRCAGAVASSVGKDEIVVELADVGVNRAGSAARIVVVAHRQRQVGIPTVDERSDIGFEAAAAAIIADDGKAQGVGGRQGQRCGGEMGGQRFQGDLRGARQSHERRQPARQPDQRQGGQDEDDGAPPPAHQI